MKIVHTELIIYAGDFSNSDAWKNIEANIHEAIKSEVIFLPAIVQ